MSKAASDEWSAFSADYSAKREKCKKEAGGSLPQIEKLLLMSDGKQRALTSLIQSAHLDGEHGKGSQVMLSRCANSQCSKPFLKLREGKLFLVETQRLPKTGESLPPSLVRARQQQRHVEHYWLCSECAAQWTLIYERERGIVLAPLRRPAVGIGAADGVARNGVA